jgi:hypothetical protein
MIIRQLKKLAKSSKKVIFVHLKENINQPL